MTRSPGQAAIDIVGWYNRGEIELAMMADFYYKNKLFSDVGYQMMWNAIVDLNSEISFPIELKHLCVQTIDRDLNNRIKDNIKKGLKANKKWYKYAYDKFCIALDGGAIFMKKCVYEIGYGDGMVSQYDHTFVEHINWESKIGDEVVTNYRFPHTDLVYEDEEMKIYSSHKSQVWIRLK